MDILSIRIHLKVGTLYLKLGTLSNAGVFEARSRVIDMFIDATNSSFEGVFSREFPKIYMVIDATVI